MTSHTGKQSFEPPLLGLEGVVELLADPCGTTPSPAVVYPVAKRRENQGRLVNWLHPDGHLHPFSEFLGDVFLYYGVIVFVTRVL